MIKWSCRSMCKRSLFCPSTSQQDLQNHNIKKITYNFIRVRVIISVQCHFQQHFSCIMAVRFIGGGNQSTWKKPSDLLQVTNKLYHIMLHQVQLTISRIFLNWQLTEMKGIDCKLAYKGGYKHLLIEFEFWYFRPLSAIFQLYHGNQF